MDRPVLQCATLCLVDIFTGVLGDVMAPRFTQVKLPAAFRHQVIRVAISNLTYQKYVAAKCERRLLGL